MDSAHNFAKEMRKQMEAYFVFLLKPFHKDFLPIYWVATYLCPVYRSLLTSDQLPVVRKYLEGTIIVNLFI